MTASTRRRVARVCIAVDLAALVALITVPPLRHHAPGGGWGIAASALVSVLAFLYHLHTSSREPVMTAPISLLLTFVGLFISAKVRLTAVIFGQPTSVPLVDLIAVVIVLALAVMVLFLIRAIVRDGLRLRPGRAVP